MDKAIVSVGYTRSGLHNYKEWQSPKVVGADITATDGCGNVIEVSIREGDTGYRIKLNGATISLGGLLKQDAALIS